MQITKEGLRRIIRSEVKRLREGRVSGWSSEVDAAIEALMEVVVDDMSNQGLVTPEGADGDFQDNIKRQIGEAILSIMESGAVAPRRRRARPTAD